MTPATAPAGGHVKETLVSIIIAFILAFVFRAFVIEAFIIPTGSMAPTLMGAHMRFRSENTGYEWPVGPQFYDDPRTLQIPSPVQGQPGRPVIVHDPQTREEMQIASGVRRQAGDRILVFKYLRWIYDPRRFDVVVFKAPHEPQQNYIKRLVGLPGEMVALVDGDVFVRRPAPGDAAGPWGEDWSLPGWAIQRKPHRAQRAAWQEVFSSEYQPLAPVRDWWSRNFRSPWQGQGWKIDGRTSYDYDGPGPTRLSWDNQTPDSNGRPRWPIDDFCFYNDNQVGMGGRQDPGTTFAVSDVSLRCAVEPKSGPVDVAAVLRTRGHEFRAETHGTAVTLKMGKLGDAPPGQRPPAPADWTTLATGTLPRAIAPGRTTDLEFWHADQALTLWCDGKEIAHGVYDWTPRERLANTFGVTIEQVVEKYTSGTNNVLGDYRNYRQPELWWEFSGGPLTVYRAGLSRDIFYEPFSPSRAPLPPRATHPLTTMHLSPDQFFVCGDNSPASLDARLWPAPDPWVAATIDKTEGVVPRDLMIGRAFFVYFPSMIKGAQSGLPVPDFGRLRWIW